jgi:hypothetical protein
MSNTTGDGTGSFSSGGTGGDEVHLNSSAAAAAANSNGSTITQQPPLKRKRNLPGNPGVYSPQPYIISLK